MNKAKLGTTIIVLLGLLIFLPLLAAASPTITESSVTLTADYSKFADEDDDFIVVTTESFTVDNTNGVQTEVKITVTGLPSKYKVQSAVKEITISADTTTQVTLSIEVPHDKSPGQEKIGTIVITDSNNAQLDTANLVQETVSMFDLNELEVKYVDSSGKTKKDEFTADDNTYKLEKEVKPYTEMAFTFNLQNLFDKDYLDKGELDEIELTIDTSDDFFVEGFEDTYQFENIEAGKERKYTVTLPISEEVEAETYTLEFTITAEDSEGIQYEINKEIELDIELDDDDVRIVKAQLVTDTTTVCDEETSLQVELHNFGSDDQSKVKVTLQNIELGLSETIENIAIDAHTDNGDSWQKTFLIPLEKSKAKVYFLDVKSYLGDTLFDAKVVELGLKPCTAEKPIVKEEEQEKPVTAKPEINLSEKPITDTGDITGNVIKSVEKTSYNTSDYLVALMLIAIVVSASMIVLMLVILLKA